MSALGRSRKSNVSRCTTLDTRLGILTMTVRTASSHIQRYHRRTYSYSTRTRHNTNGRRARLAMTKIWNTMRYIIDVSLSHWFNRHRVSPPCLAWERKQSVGASHGCFVAGSRTQDQSSNDWLRSMPTIQPTPWTMLSGCSRQLSSQKMPLRRIPHTAILAACRA